jgi:hypothetical protein
MGVLGRVVSRYRGSGRRAGMSGLSRRLKVDSVAAAEEWIFALEVGQRLSSASSKKPMTRRSYSAGAVSIALMCGASGTVHSDAFGPAIRL